MATFVQLAPTETQAAVYALEPSGAIRSDFGGPPTVKPFRSNDQATGIDTVVTVDNRPAVSPATWPADVAAQSSGGFHWFETFHVIPRSLDFGNLLSPQSVDLEVFSAFRRTTKPWSTFTNNAGLGVSLGGLPSLPVNVAPLTGVALTVDVDTVGDPFVDSTLEFGFSGVGTATVPIEIQRIVLWGARPELPFVEILSFLTDVQPAAGGVEKRISIRPFPRRRWSYEYLLDEGSEVQTLENLLFDFQALTFGLPVWFEGTSLTSAVTAGDTVISVGGTSFRDFRVGGLAVILESQGSFDVLPISAIGSSSLTLGSPAVNSYAAGVEVFPLLPCYVGREVSGDRFPVNLRRARISFEAIDNVVALASLSGFSTFNGRLLLDVGNSMIRGNVDQGFDIQLVRSDPGSGLVFQTSRWTRNKRTHRFTMRAEGREAIWNMRRMIYALRGRQVPFYVPTSSDDLDAVANLLSASNTIDVANVGYAQHVRSRSPRNGIRVNFVDGSTPLLRTITAAANISTAVDRLTVDTNWPSTITPAEISRIEYVEPVRLDSDDVRIEYDPSGFRARMVSPLRSLFT